MNFPDKLQKKLENRIENNSYRELLPCSERIDFSSNDYLGFSKNKNISEQVQISLDQFENLNGSTGSRLITGNHFIYEELEAELAEFFGTSDALLFNSGYDANLGLFASVPQHGDVILFDEFCHASIRDGIKLSNAKSFSFKHNNVEDLQKKYRNTSNHNGNTFLAVESIYSMDGDQAPLIELVEFCQKKQIYLIVDEAHATGVFGNSGRGLVSQLKLDEQVFAKIHTFGKSMGCHGAIVLGSKYLKYFLINFARSFIYTTAIPIHNVLTIRFALKELLETQKIIGLLSNIGFFKNKLKEHKLENIFIKSNSAIQSCIIPENIKVKEVAQILRDQNFDVKPILSPTVPLGKERLRFCIHSYNSNEEISNVLKLLVTFVN